MRNREEVIEDDEATDWGRVGEEDIPSNTKLPCVLLDLIKSRVFTMFQYSLYISVYSERSKDGVEGYGFGGRRIIGLIRLNELDIGKVRERERRQE